MTRRITPVILSGGSGTRLWPLSRSSRPKQLLNLTHELTMLQLTALRCADPERFEPALVVANAAHAEIVEDQLQVGGTELSAVILEPVGRNTAPAIGLAALALIDVDPDAIMLVMPSDHVIEDIEAFARAVEAAIPAVEDGWLATFGITPDAADTGYGYIQMGETLMPGVQKAERFVEKPDAETAQRYLDEGNYAWNGGIFLFRVDSFLAALANNAPEIAVSIRKSMDAAGRRGKRLYPEPKSFAQTPSISVDYAIMEKAENVAVVPVDMGWSDVGSWDALYGLAEKDHHGNAPRGDVISIASEGCLIRTDGPLVTTIGVTDLIVVATSDAVMILPRGRSQEVKLMVDALKEREHKALG